MRLQKFAYGGAVASLRAPDVPAMLSAEALEWLGDPTPEIVEGLEEKRRFVTALGHWPATSAAWAEVRVGIAPALERFDGVERALGLAGIPAGPGYLGIDERALRATFRYSNRLRARYTTVDFLEGQHRLGEAIDTALGYQRW
jgi:hypothetical protein